MLSEFSLGSLYALKVLDVESYKTHLTHVERRIVPLGNHVNDRLPSRMPNGQLIIDVRICLGQVRHDQSCLEKLLDDLNRDNPRTPYIVGSLDIIGLLEDSSYDVL